MLSQEAAVPHEVLLPGIIMWIRVYPIESRDVLSEHPDRQFVGYVVRGLRRGFRVGCQSSALKLRSAPSNMVSAIRHPDVTDKYLRDELEANRLVDVIGVGIDATL